MKIYKVMKFWSNGWNDGHSCLGTFVSREKAEDCFKELGLKDDPKDSKKYWSDHILEEEID
jgi:hypothetical protein